MQVSILQVHHMRDVLLRLHDAIADFINASGMSPSSGSQAQNEIEAWPHGEEVLTSLSQAHLLLESVADHSFALTRLMLVPIATVAPWTCARAALEAAAYGCWLLDPAADARERAGRGLAFRYDGVREQLKLARASLDKKAVADAEARLGDIVSQAQHCGYAAIEDKNGKCIGAGSSMPTATECIRAQLHKEFEYRVFSAMAHSQASAVAQLGFKPVDAANPTVLEKGMSPTSAALLLITSQQVLVSVTRAKALLFGHDVAALDRIAKAALAEVGTFAKMQGQQRSSS